MKKTKKLISMILCLVLLASVAVMPADAVFEPSKPSGLEAEAYEDSVFLFWDEVPFSSGYRVFQRVDGKWKKLADVEDIVYHVENLKPSTSYTFAIRTYRKIGRQYVWSKSFTTVKIKTESIGNIYNLDASPKANSVKLEWTPVYGASGYRVFRYKAGKWIKIKDFSVKNNDDRASVSYTVTGLEPDKAYIFAVRPFVNTGKGKSWSEKYTKIKVTTKTLYELSVQAVDKKEGSVTLGWDKVDGARGYRLYRRVDGKWKAIKTTTALSFKATGLNMNKAQYFCIRAYKVTDGKTVWYPLSKTCKVTPAKVPASAAEICSAYNTAVNNLKSYKGKVKVSEKMVIFTEVTDAPESIASLLNSVLESFNGEERVVKTFEKGESTDGYALGKFIPPYGNKAMLTKSDVSSASVEASSEGYTITLVIKKDASEYDGKTNKPVTHHGKLLNPMNISVLDVSPVTITYAKFVYPGTTVKASVDSKGRLTRLDIDCDVKAEVEGKMNPVSMRLGMNISNDMTYTMVYY